MKAYVITSLCLNLFVLFVRLGYLSWKEYPRVVTYSRRQDCLGLLLGMGFIAWAAWALWL